MKENKDKQFYLTVKNTATGKYEKVFVTEEVYRAYKSTERAERKRKQRMMRCTISNEKGKPVRCHKNCAECELNRLGLVPNTTPLSLEALIEQDFDIPDPNSDFTDKILEQSDEDEKERLYKAIEQLTPRQQELIRLTYFEGLTQKQIAEFEGVKQCSISLALTRAEATLKKILENF